MRYERELIIGAYAVEIVIFTLCGAKFTVNTFVYKIKDRVIIFKKYFSFQNYHCGWVRTRLSPWRRKEMTMTKPNILMHHARKIVELSSKPTNNALILCEYAPHAPRLRMFNEIFDRTFVAASVEDLIEVVCVDKNLCLIIVYDNEVDQELLETLRATHAVKPEIWILLIKQKMDLDWENKQFSTTETIELVESAVDDGTEDFPESRLNLFRGFFKSYENTCASAATGAE